VSSLELKCASRDDYHTLNAIGTPEKHLMKMPFGLRTVRLSIYY